jgi:hypothetical protein
MKRRLTNVSPLKLGITLGVIYGILSLIIVVPLFLIISLVGAATAAKGGGQALPALFSGVFIIFLPIIYAVLGFIAGVIMAFVYNLVAKWTGGVEFTTEEVS